MSVSAITESSESDDSYSLEPSFSSFVLFTLEFCFFSAVFDSGSEIISGPHPISDVFEFEINLLGEDSLSGIISFPADFSF